MALGREKETAKTCFCRKTRMKDDVIDLNQSNSFVRLGMMNSKCRKEIITCNGN